MNKSIAVFVLLFVFFISCGHVFSADMGSALVNISILPIKEFSPGGVVKNLAVNSSSTADNPPGAVNSSAAYNISVNTPGKKITGRLTNSLPDGVILKVNLEAPSGAVTCGEVTLTTSPQNLVTGINSGTASSDKIIYKLSTAGPIGSVSPALVTVNFVFTD